MTATQASAIPPARGVARFAPAWIWPCLAVCAASIPFLPGLSLSRVFYIRDLSLFFWGRYLWLRRTIFSGEWPFWDPYVGGGQSAVADALHQMFLLPVLAVRLIGSEVVGFNLWVALPFPLAAIGAWAFLVGRFSAPASALGAIAFSVAGPVVSTGNFPNMSWSVAALPWMLWAADRAARAPSAARHSVLALVVAFQALAGEPVTLFATLALTVAFAAVVASPSAQSFPWPRWRVGMRVVPGMALGLALAAIQLIPMAHAARLAERSNVSGRDFWSLHPLGLLETVAPTLYGDFYSSQSLASVPWMPLLNGREPFFYSLYFGVPLLALSLFGLIAGKAREWTIFWTIAGAIALVAAFGGHTPLYPLVRDHLPVLGWFRFPVKYFVVSAMAVACAAAAGWDAMTNDDARRDAMWHRRGRNAAVAFALAVGIVAYVVAGACIYFTTPTAFRIFSIAKSLGAPDPVAAAAFMLKSMPRLATSLMLLSLATAVLVYLAAGVRREARVAGGLLYTLLVVDLVLRAWGINPTFDVSHLGEPEWLARTKAQSDVRFYVGGKHDGTLDAADLDSSRAFLNPTGLRGSASRAALSGQAAFYPSAWHAREMLSYDLPVLWPRTFQLATEQFFAADRAGRDRFLDRTGVRYRALPERLSAGHTPLVAVPYFLRSFLYDWGDHVASRATVVSDVRVVPDTMRQIETLFKDGWDSRITALVEREIAPAGQIGAPVAPYATVVSDTGTRVIVDAGAGPDRGYLVLLDSYSDDWRATVDGRPAVMVRANGLFRAVHVDVGRHTVEFVYRPRALQWGMAVSGAALVLLSMMLFVSTARSRAAGETLPAKPNGPAL